MRGYNIFKLILAFMIAIFISLPCARTEIYNFDGKQKPAETLSQEGIFVKLRMQESAGESAAVFIYQIDSVENPHIIPDRVFEDSLLLLEKGNNYFSRKNYPEALRYYNKAVKVNDLFVAGYHNLGITYFLMGRYNDSIRNFKKISSIQPSAGLPYFYLGWIYKRLENPRRAKIYLKKAKGYFESEKDFYLINQTELLLNSLPLVP